MSDGGLGDDLFPDSPEPTTAPPDATTQPVASGSRSRTPTPSPTADPPMPGSSHHSPAPVSPAEGQDEDEDKDEDDDDMGGLFGDDDEDERNPENGDEGEDVKRDSSATPEANPLEYEEEEGEGVEVEQYYTNLMLPKQPRMSATDGKVWHMKLPAYVNIDHKPYDADYYHATAEDDEIDGKEQPMLAKQKILAVKNTIRWRWTAGLDGQQKQESNARMVRWSDGSMSLQLGSDLFDVASSHGSSLARPEDLEKSGKLIPTEEAASSSTTFLCTPSTYERVLVTETAIAGQLSLVPTSRTSKTHIELVKHVGQQHVKHSRMIIIDERTDPNLSELLLKAAGKDPNKTQRPKAKRAQGSGGSGRKTSRRITNYSDDENDLPQRKGAPGDYEDDDGFIVADDDEEDEAEETEDEDEMAWGSSKKHKSKSKSSKSRKRKGSDDEDDEMDEMEEAERRIEQRERERKRAKKEKKKKSRDYVDTDEDEDVDEDAGGDDDAQGEQDMEMDMESEED